MDAYELAKKWLSENARRFYCAQMDSDEIALSAFAAGFKAAQQGVHSTGLRCPTHGEPVSDLIYFACGCSQELHAK